ncbi:RGCVC family protein [Pseudonocardia sp. N23]|uniref:RGCVC family protein n=1 Tax=Pseudonocardia sp. N23 TaxID=1987376 RepID=UPI000BFE7282|nr:RGCVC family protein [Pseudonocardia sp. N23]
MNDSVPTVEQTRPVIDDSRVTCPACPHDVAAHDRIGLRFCAVTAERSLDRGCACSTG